MSSKGRIDIYERVIEIQNNQSHIITSRLTDRSKNKI